MIPKIIHYCWFGNNPKDEASLKYIEGWKRLLPDYQIKEWNDGNLKEISNKYVTEAYQQKKWAFVSDYFRLYALYNDGGIYFDTDVEVKKSFDEFLDLDFFIGSEQYGKRKSLATAVIGAQKQSKIVARLLKEYDEIGFIKPDGTLDQTPNTVRLRAPLKELGFKEFCSNKDPIYLDSKNVIFPVQYFSKDTPQSYAVHHFAGSWVDDFKHKDILTIPLNSKNKLVLRKYKQKRKNTSCEFGQNEKVLCRLGGKKKFWCLLKVVRETNA